MAVDTHISFRLAEEPVKRAVRLLAHQRVRRAERTFRKAVEADTQALHDFRVTLRKLRTIFRLYEPWLAGSIGKKSQRRLRKLTRASNDGRDFEVFLALSDKLGLNDALKQRLADERATHLQKFQKAAVKQFPRIARSLKKSLAAYLVRVKPARVDSERFGAATATIALELAEQLSRELGAVSMADQQEEAHRARIIGKRIRYTLEPFRRDSHSSRIAVDALKRMQDELGYLHDLFMLSTRLPGMLDELPEVDAARELAIVQGELDRTFALAYANWFQSGGASLREQVYDAARELSRQARPRDIEIERKFLLRRMPRLRNVESVEISQGYLPGAKIHERVRRVKGAKVTQYFRTIKAGSGLVRQESEEEIDADLFKQLWRLTQGRRIRKRRYFVPAGSLVWTIDRFRDRPLFLAEVELDTPEQEAELPAWLRELVVSDVTDDPNYTNHALAK